ncbi:TnsA endonuclease N-terminal domain-containing protein [Thalassotalea sp. SU-HH00458]|uniref:TnsA endonuclease N-terminal domain-containing protein n=1 Tax=Thalassotalea sp. SU-HH00458 TaxID=3127657 RepID=UPI00310AB898
MKQRIITKEIIKSIDKWNAELDRLGEHHPWVKVTQVNKVGRRHLHKCLKQNRTIHLLSDGEKRAYKILIWRPDTLKIEEQFPLDINETLDIANELGYLHSGDYKTKAAHVMSTDFYTEHVSFETGELVRRAYNFKYWNQLWRHDDNGVLKKAHYRVWQKIEIEKLYWKRRGVKLFLISEREATKKICWNLDWFATEARAKVCDTEKLEFTQAFYDSWYSNKFLPTIDHITNAGNAISLDIKRSQTVFKKVALDRVLKLDLTKQILLREPLKVLT